MFELMKQVFTRLSYFSKFLLSVGNTPDHVKCKSLSNQKFMTQPTIINLHPNEYIEGLC